MLYHNLTNWDSYIVVSKKYVSIWNSNNKLVIMKTENFKNMAETILKNKDKTESKEKTE